MSPHAPPSLPDLDSGHLLACSHVAAPRRPSRSDHSLTRMHATANVLRRAKVRCLTRMQAFEQGVENYTQQKVSKGENPQKGYENYQKQVKGIMSLDEEDGSISIDEDMQRWLDSIEDSKDQDVRIVAAPEQDHANKKARAGEYTPMFQPSRVRLADARCILCTANMKTKPTCATRKLGNITTIDAAQSPRMQYTEAVSDQ